MSEVLDLVQPMQAMQASDSQAPSSSGETETRYQCNEFEFALSSSVIAFVKFQNIRKDGFTIQELKRLIALLELQRSFLAEEPLDVTVTVSTPRPREALGSAEIPVNVADPLTVLRSMPAQ